MYDLYIYIYTYIYIYIHILSVVCVFLIYMSADCACISTYIRTYIYIYVYIYIKKYVHDSFQPFLFVTALVKSDNKKHQLLPVSSSLSPSATLSRTALTQSAQREDGDNEAMGKW